MRIEIHADPVGGLQVLPLIPSGNLLRLEGRNGVGKTVAVHLLELCTGDRPYVGREASWRTLREQLGRARIEVSDLAEGDELEFQLNPNEWPELPEPFGDWLGTAKHNGTIIPWSEVPDIFRVSRVGGDETLGESLAGQVARDREQLRLLVSAQQSRRDHWSGQAIRIVRQTAFARGLHLKGLAKTAADARRRYKQARDAVDAAQQQVDGIRAAADLLRQADELDTQLPLLDQQILDLTSQEGDLRGKIDEADVDVARRLSDSDASKAQVEEAARLTNLLRLRRERRIRRRRAVDAAAAAAGVDTPVDLEEVQSDRRHIQDEIEGLRRQRLAVDRVGLVLELIGDVQRPMARANNRGLGEEVVAELADSRQITVAALDTGLVERRETLAGVSTDEARRLALQIRSVEQRLGALDELPGLVRLRDKAEADLDETAAELEHLTEKLGGTASAAYRQAVERRAELLDDLTSLIVARSELEARVSALTANGSAAVLRVSAQSRLAENQVAGDLTPEAVDAVLPPALEVVEEALNNLGAIQQLRDDAAARLADAEAAARASVAALAEDVELSWLGVAPLGLLPHTDSALDNQVEALARLERVAGHLNRVLVATLNDIQSLEQALEDLASRLRTMNVGEVPAGRLALAVRRHYEGFFSQELAEVEELRNALFDGSQKVQVDLREMSVAWQTPAGLRQSRPLEAFSSGQRAFAYTRVQMERQADVHARNRLLVLDEFGAFIAQDRFDVLVRYLKDRAIGRLADQIVLILPTRQRAGEPSEQKPALDGNGYIVNTLS